MEAKEIFNIGDRVSRKKEFHGCNTGTIVSIDEYDCCKIKWDEKSGKYNKPGIGQQHSTLQQKFLKHI